MKTSICMLPNYSEWLNKFAVTTTRRLCNTMRFFDSFLTHTNHAFVFSRVRGPPTSDCPAKLIQASWTESTCSFAHCPHDLDVWSSWGCNYKQWTLGEAKASFSAGTGWCPVEHYSLSLARREAFVLGSEQVTHCQNRSQASASSHVPALLVQIDGPFDALLQPVLSLLRLSILSQTKSIFLPPCFFIKLF